MNDLKYLILASTLTLFACSDDSNTTSPNPGANEGEPSTLVGDPIKPLAFTQNPYPHIPPQCYIETSGGTQNACQYCHTNGTYKARLGNNHPQAGMDLRIGNFQLEYAFGPYDTNTPLAVVNRWENTLKPELLRTAVTEMGINPADWDMRSYIRSDNWEAAYAKRLGSPKDWDAGIESPWRLFPGLDPVDLPADSDGFVRSSNEKNTFFKDQLGGITGWRSINFMPYGIFIPMSGSVSGIYIRLPEKFMQTIEGEFDLSIYQRNLDLVERAIQDRLRLEDGVNYVGNAADEVIERGLYPLGTEFAHPLHYVDVGADLESDVSPFPGTRSRRVKEVRYMYKSHHWDPEQFRPGDKAEGSSIYGRDDQGWVDNGAGWILAGFIEDRDGALRPQTREEMTQCIGCHSGITRTEFPTFTSGSGNTIDSTWALPRKFSGELGWQEMNYLAYQSSDSAGSDETPGQAGQGDPLNRDLDKGELAYFLETVVGASLYGDMPPAIETALKTEITVERGYAENWPELDTSSAEAFIAAQALRQALMREFTAQGAHLSAEGSIKGCLLYPPEDDALAAAARYRQVVVTQRYNLGKDVFSETPVTFRHFRKQSDALTRLDGTSYQTGEIITERAVNKDDPTSFNYLVGSTLTGIDETRPYPEGNYNPDYLPLLKAPLEYESQSAASE